MLCKDESGKSKLSVCAFGLAIGLAEGLYMLLFAWITGIFGYGTPLITDIAHVFYGYAPSFIGGLFGSIWGFIDGFIFGIIAAWIYNLVLSGCCKKISISSENKTSDK